MTSQSVTVPNGTGYARWDVVEIAPGTEIVLSDVRDIWDPGIPPDGAFAPETVDKDIRSKAVVSIRAGSDNSPNPPNFPYGLPGRIPICYVYVGSDGSISDERDGIVMCRPLLRPPGATDTMPKSRVSAMCG